MLKKMLNHKLRIVLVMLLILFLVLIRAYEDALFYDPFLIYFKMDYTNLHLPEVDNIKLLFGLFFRYSLNTILSLAIIYTIFKDLELIKFAALLYLIFFIVLVMGFSLVFSYSGEENKMGLFYIRRFLIQPLFLLLFIPAFLYQKQNK